MEVSAVGQAHDDPPHAADPWQAVGPGGKPAKVNGDLAGLKKELEEFKKTITFGFAGVGVGKGQEGKGPGKGATGKKINCFNCGGDHFARDCLKGKGGKGKGKGGGKGPRPQRPRWGVCRDFARTGKCPRLAQFGHCKVAHVRLGGKLAAIDGLVLDDISGVATCDCKKSCFVLTNEAGVRPDLADIVAAELAELCGACSPSGSETPLLGQAPF